MQFQFEKKIKIKKVIRAWTVTSECKRRNKGYLYCSHFSFHHGLCIMHVRQMQQKLYCIHFKNIFMDAFCYEIKLLHILILVTSMHTCIRLMSTPDYKCVLYVHLKIHLKSPQRQTIWFVWAQEYISLPPSRSLLHKQKGNILRTKPCSDLLYTDLACPQKIFLLWKLWLLPPRTDIRTPYKG